MTSAVEVTLTDKVLLITGAAGGIGQTLVRRSLAAGARVAAFDIRPEIHTIFPAHSHLLTLQGDACNEADVAGAVTQFNERWHQLDALINNAGCTGSGHVESLALTDWQRVLQTNLTSVFLFSKHCIPLLRASRGAIVSLSSTNGLTGGSPLSGPAYATAKAGIIALMKNIARDLAQDGVRANTVAPGPIDTPMLNRLSDETRAQLRETIPLGTLGTTDDVANLVLFLASSAALHITGATFSLSGGLVMH